MPRINYILADGSKRTVEAADGESIMLAAVQNNVLGIAAECGGFLNCATCHVYVEPEWLDRLPPVSDHEDEMLDGTVADRLPNSRLSCQLPVDAALDGVTVKLPDRQT